MLTSVSDGEPITIPSGSRSRIVQRRGQAQAVLQPGHAAGLRGRERPDPVTERDARPHADTRPQGRECALERVDRQPLPLRIGQVSRGTGAVEHYVEQRCTP